MLNRAFFSLQSNWIPTAVALGNLFLNALLDWLFYPLGAWGIPLSTALVNVAGTIALVIALRREIGGIDGARTASSGRPCRRRLGRRGRDRLRDLEAARRRARPPLHLPVLSLSLGLGAGLAVYVGVAASFAFASSTSCSRSGAGALRLSRRATRDHRHPRLRALVL